MRTTFIKTLTKLATYNKNIYLLTGDLGFSVFENFIAQFPDQYINCGVAEQNMIGTAAGFALSGKKVFVYSIVPFATMRCFEQIRNDICAHNLDVKIVGIGGGFSYGEQGKTHHGIEDVALMRTLRNMTVLCPTDPQETEMALYALAETTTPAYLRLEKNSENIYTTPPTFRIGQANILRNGTDAMIISYGSLLKEALIAAEILEKEEKISIKILAMPTLKPIGKEQIIENAKTINVILTLEEHLLYGGLGEAIGAILMESPLITSKIFRRLGIDDTLPPIIGNQQYLRTYYGLSAQSIKDQLKNIIKEK